MMEMRGVDNETGMIDWVGLSGGECAVGDGTENDGLSGGAMLCCSFCFTFT